MSLRCEIPRALKIWEPVPYSIMVGDTDWAGLSA